MSDDEHAYEWELIEEVNFPYAAPASHTARLRVPGGWLYRTLTLHLSKPDVTMVYVPDPSVYVVS